MSEYKPRCIEHTIKDNLDAFGAILIVGPKWCGKTTTAKLFSQSVVEMGRPQERERCIRIFQIDDMRLLNGKKPRLFDEWQSIPELWDTIRCDIDSKNLSGQYILTGSVTIDRSKIQHSGAGRISTIRMSTMSLFESGDSSGEVSVNGLFKDGYEVVGESDITVETVAKLIVRGGWPGTLEKDEQVQKTEISGYCKNMLDYDISHTDGKFRDPSRMKLILRSLARNESTEAKNTSILADMSQGDSHSMNMNTLSDYLGALELLYVTDNLPAWCPRLRSKTAIRTSDVRHFVDPAIGTYFLNASAEDLLEDPRTFGLYFESLVIRDLRVYAMVNDGELFHYRDGDGLEADAVMHLRNGKWAAFEVKLAVCDIDAAAKNLIRLSEKVDGRKPSFLAVITPNGQAYRRKDGVCVIPVGCLAP